MNQAWTIAANSPIEKIMSPMLRILLIFECTSFNPANKPAREKSIQYRTGGMWRTFSPLIPLFKKVKGIITNEKQIIPIKVTSNFRCLISVTIKKYHQQSRIVREVA